MKALRYAWALPATCVGATLGLVALTRGARVRVVEGTLEVAGGMPPRFGFGAITFGHVIIGQSAQCLAACRSHELVHVRQYERWGVLFFALYAGSSLVQWLRGGDPYRDNRFEREAYAADRRARPGEPIPPPGGG
ncbi:MAG TPA: hypothetical protein VFJ62_21830 [Usitatibacter sp.]|nr:hypothetical protein [Usitatibacter sp.]